MRTSAALVVLALVGLSVAIPWSDDLLYSSLSIASSTYCGVPQLQDWSCKPCYQSYLKDVSVFTNASLNVQGVTGFSPELNSIVVAFRGTIEESIINWVQNLKAEKVPWPCNWDECGTAEVHLGFYECFQSVFHDVQFSMNALLAAHPTSSVLFIGHSLGGAITTLTAMGMLNLGLDGARVTIVTFGEPRVGNMLFSQIVHNHIGTIFRVTNHNDVVPHVPTRSMGFYHEPQEVWIHTTQQSVNTLSFCTAEDGEDPACADSSLADSVHDHLYYLNATLDTSAC
eukprot:m.75848 g.75848  ORF g.75848 m.75848 type:complete len:284 (+) comp14613_c2_seq5:213-1064(+)